MIRMKKILAITTCSIVLSCTNASTDDLIEATPLPNPVTYADHVKPIIDSNCINCHSTTPSNGASISLTTYAEVKTAILNYNLISKINGNGPGSLMPYGGQKLPQNQIDLITKWQTDGFVEN